MRFNRERLLELGRNITAIMIMVSAVLLVFLFLLFRSRGEEGTSNPLLTGTLSISFVLALILCFLSLYRWEVLRQDYRRQQKIAQELALLKEAVETMEIGLTITDTSGRILYVNHADASMHGYQPAELLGREARIYAPPEKWRQMTIEEIQDAARRPRENVNIRSNGATFPVHLISNVVRDKKGRPIGFVTSCEDITERKKAEEELKESQRRLRRLAQHLDIVREEERTRVAREIYHDIGTPLTMLKLDLSMIEKHFGGVGSEQLGRVFRMHENIDSTIDMVRSIAHELSPSSLIDQLGLLGTLESDTEILQKKKDVRLELELPGKEPSGSLDVKKALYRAWKETIATSLEHTKPTVIRTVLSHAHGEICLEISDNGTGLPDDEELEGRIGLSLDAVRERVGLVGGTVSISDDPGEGTITRVRVPAGVAEEEA